MNYQLCCAAVRSMSLSLLCLAVLGQSGSLMGAVINYNTTINASNSYPSESVEVGLGMGAPPPTVGIVAGGVVGGDVRVYRVSVLNMSGGQVGGLLQAKNASQANLSGGVVGSAQAVESGTLNISGGVVSSNVDTYNIGTANISGGTIQGTLIGNFASTIEVTGGTIQGSLQAIDSSQVTLYGGNYSGGLVAGGVGTLDVYGGQIAGSLYVHSMGKINVYGTNLQIAGSTLTGTLADGTPISNFVIDGPSPGSIVLHDFQFPIPEPSSFALALLGLIPIGIRYQRGGLR